MKRQKFIAIAAALLIAVTAFAETPVGKAMREELEERLDEIFDLESDLEFEESNGLIVDDDGIIDPEYGESENEKEQEQNSNAMKIQAIISGETVDLSPELHWLKLELEEKNLKPDEIKESLLKYAVAANEYSLNSEEREVLAAAVIKNSDFNLTMELFDFLKMTSSGVFAIDDIYLMIEDKDISIEEAYAIYTGREDQELSLADIIYYVSQGISTDEILALYEISLGTEDGLRTMLDKKLEGKTWNELIAEEFGIDGQFNYYDYSIREILYGTNVARKVNRPFAEVVQNCSESSIISDDIAAELIKKQEFTSIYYKSIGEFENLNDEIITDVIKLVPDLNKDSAMSLIEQNYSVADILQAVDAGLIIEADNIAAIGREKEVER